MNVNTDLLGLAADAISVASPVLAVVFSLLAWLSTKRLQAQQQREQERLSEQVFICLVSGTDRKVLPLELNRAELNRAELLGRLGMMPMREVGKRFGLAYLATPAFLRALREAREGRGNWTVEIPCTQAEIEQFAI